VVSDHVRSLEERCRARLVERTTRRLKLTQVGERILSIATAVVGAARDVDAILEEHRDAPAGTLRVATTHDLGARFVAPLVARLATRHPQLSVEIVSDDAPHDLIGGRFDVAVRLGAPRDSELVLKKLWSFSEPIVAAPEVASSFAQVKRPRDLAGAPWVRHSVIPTRETWQFRGPRGEVDEISVNVRAQANTGDGVRGLLLGGAGFGVLPEYQVAADLRRGALVGVCPGWSWKEVTLYAVLPSKRQPKRVEIFLGELRDAVRPGIMTEPSF
jgi:DNA-binding transcriptional LysR family regulator